MRKKSVQNIIYQHDKLLNMKITLAFAILLFHSVLYPYAQSTPERTKKYLISIRDINYSMAYSHIYNINNDNIKVVFHGGLVGERDSLIFDKKLSQSETNIFIKLLSSIPLSKLKDNYSDPWILDGDRKVVELSIGKLNKTINIENAYQKDMDTLFKAVNRVIPKNIMIYYVKRKKRK